MASGPRVRSAAAAGKPRVEAAARMPPRPLTTERLSDRLAALLISEIQSGRWRPGDRLPTEAQMAASHGVSRSVVREAVHQVKSRGLLIARQGSGLFVAAPPPQQPLAFDPGVLTSIESVLQVVELRRVLEGEIAALAAERARRAQVTRLRRQLAAVDEATDAGQDGVAEDMAFHRAIADVTGNPQFPRLLAFLEQYLLEAMRVTKGNESRRADFMQQVRDEHRAIVDAIAAGDPVAARRSAIEHLRRGEWRLVEGGVIPRRRRETRAAASRAQKGGRR